MKEHQMYPHNPSSAESILNEKMSAISHAWLDDQRAAVIEAMKEHASNEVAKYKTVVEKLLPLADGYCTYLSGVLDYIPNDSDGKFELENSRSLIDEAKKLIKS